MLWTIKQPENRSTNTNQWINSLQKYQWIYQSMTQFINQSNSPINQPTNQSTKSTNQFPDQCTGQKKHTPSILTQGIIWNFSHQGYPDSTAWRIVVYVVITHKPGGEIGMKSIPRGPFQGYYRPQRVDISVSNRLEFVKNDPFWFCDILEGYFASGMRRQYIRRLNCVCCLLELFGCPLYILWNNSRATLTNYCKQYQGKQLYSTQLLPGGHHLNVKKGARTQASSHAFVIFNITCLFKPCNMDHTHWQHRLLSKAVGLNGKTPIQ